MKLVNSMLFSEISEEESDILRPDESPWESLSRFTHSVEAIRTRSQPVPEAWRSFQELEARVAKSHAEIDPEGKARIWGGEGLDSDSTAYIKGPVVLGKNVTIRRGAVITGPCWIGDNAHIGHNCRVKYAIIRENTRIVYGTHLAYSVIGRGVHVGKSVIFDDFPPPELFRKMFPVFEACGSAIGDSCRIGAGSIFGPFTALMPRTIVPLGTKLA